MEGVVLSVGAGRRKQAGPDLGALQFEGSMPRVKGPGFEQRDDVRGVDDGSDSDDCSFHSSDSVQNSGQHPLPYSHQQHTPGASSCAPESERPVLSVVERRLSGRIATAIPMEVTR